VLKINVFLTRRVGLTREEFDEYWTSKHTPLLAAMPATQEVVRRYVQLHAINDTVDGLPTAPYDGVAEVWVDDIAAAAALFASDHYNTVIAADEANFMDRSKTVFLYADETVIVD
jgi:uncharacterized protein (TIGR02118 family)